MELPAPSSLILVAVMTQPRDLEIARLLGWYRIPLRSAPKVIAVDYLAFYQTAAFGEDRWRIRYVAPVRGHELTTRGELLRDEANHPRAQQEYFKIQIGQLIELSQPILARRWRRLTFLYTTGEYLLRARSLNDLVVDSSERQLLWRALRERAAQESQYGTGCEDSGQQVPMEDDWPELDVDPTVLAALLGLAGMTGRHLQEKKPE